MPLDWLFGSKKKPEVELPLPTVDEASLPTSSGEDFVLVGSERMPSNNMRPSVSLPYTLAPEQRSGTQDLHINQNFLQDVPFKLAASETFHEIDSATAYQLRASQMISYVRENLTSEIFDYDFKVEKSVIREAGSRDLG